MERDVVDGTEQAPIVVAREPARGGDGRGFALGHPERHSEIKESLADGVREYGNEFGQRCQVKNYGEIRRLFETNPDEPLRSRELPHAPRSQPRRCRRVRLARGQGHFPADHAPEVPSAHD